MGGRGSGLRLGINKASSTEDYRSLDIRYLARNGLLEPGKVSVLHWSVGERTTGRIGIRGGFNSVELTYRVGSIGQEMRERRYLINLVSTPCHLGGARQWFECPAKDCRRRVAILYGGDIFVCRTCRQLQYPSQSVSSWERALLKAEKVRDQLKWRPGVFNGMDLTKPKGMHWATYSQLLRRYRDLTDEWTSGLRSTL
ncbi:MAG: hypothetical protein O9248_00690 [Rhodobacteraceae bacterium]|nr:hypothetical protein [Paracoccaceae bacterium]